VWFVRVWAVLLVVHFLNDGWCAHPVADTIWRLNSDAESFPISRRPRKSGYFDGYEDA